MKEIVEAIETFENVFQYSGRGMQGKECIAFQTDDVIQAMVELTKTLHEEIDAQTTKGRILLDDALEKIKGAKVDSLGLSQVVYFPAIEWPEGYEE